MAAPTLDRERAHAVEARYVPVGPVVASSRPVIFASLTVVVLLVWMLMSLMWGLAAG
jgi:hypothetical protein